MSLKPEEMTCRLSIGYMQSGRGPLGEHLPEQLVATGKAGRSASWYRAERSAHWINSRLLKRVFLPLIRT